MQFACEGVRYDTAELIEFRTGDARNPFVYATPDRQRWFLAEVDRWDGVSVRGVTADEVAALAARFGIDELRRP
jgi:hypothetical protein